MNLHRTDVVSLFDVNLKPWSSRVASVRESHSGQVSLALGHQLVQLPGVGIRRKLMLGDVHIKSIQRGADLSIRGCRRSRSGSGGKLREARLTDDFTKVPDATEYLH